MGALYPRSRDVFAKEHHIGLERPTALQTIHHPKLATYIHVCIAVRRCSQPLNPRQHNVRVGRLESTLKTAAGLPGAAPKAHDPRQGAMELDHRLMTRRLVQGGHQYGPNEDEGVVGE